MKKLGIFSLFLLLVFTACRQDIDEITVSEQIPSPEPGYETLVEDVDASALIVVVDENESPVVGARVVHQGQTYVSNSYGHVFLSERTLNAQGTYVAVQKDGYYASSRVFYPTANSHNTAVVQLIPQVFIASFPAADGDVVNVDGGATVEFFPNSIQDASGAAYQGTVRVAAYWLDPTDTRTFNEMPGSLTGLDTGSEVVALATYGMLAVELRGEAGEELNIAEAHEATISMPVPDALLASAPATIPLWSFNDQLELWLEESTARLEGNRYVGQVSHFSFWNCDEPFDLVELELTLVDQSGQPIPDAQVIIQRADATVAGARTNSEGIAAGKIPANEELLLKILGPCGTIAGPFAIGPFSSDVELKQVGDLSDLISKTLVGRLVDCDGNDIENGLVMLDIDGKDQYHYVEDGVFSFSFLHCSSSTEMSYRGIDVDALVESDALTVPLVGSVINAGNVEVCDQALTDYILVTANGRTAILTNPGILNGPGYTEVGEDFVDPEDDGIRFAFEGNTPGDYSDPGVSHVEFVTYRDYQWRLLGNSQQARVDSFIITRYDTVMEGTITGRFFNMTNNEFLDVTIEFSLNL
ncbi:MAG: hypothetical protein AAFW73_17055 [Bacteroidota bacterium]